MTRLRLHLLLLLVGFAVASSAVCAEAPAGLKRVAILSQDAARISKFYDSLRESFRELGYVEGKTIAFEYRPRWQLMTSSGPPQRNWSD